MMASMSNVNGGTGAPEGAGNSATSGGSTDPGSSGDLSRPGGGLPVSGRRLERKISGRMVAGVCAGVADYAGLDVTLVRVIFAVLAFFGGSGLIAYLIAWALMPEEGEKVSIADKFINKDGT